MIRLETSAMDLEATRPIQLVHDFDVAYLAPCEVAELASVPTTKRVTAEPDFDPHLDDEPAAEPTKSKRKKQNKAKHNTDIGTHRGIESMLRNSYRAQLAMIALAARKANIMISVNGFLLSLLTLSSAYILTNEPILLIPAGTFLITCILAILFAVLAARPQKVDKTKTRMKDFRKGRADLLVFEHFAQLSKEDHMSVMLEMMEDKEKVYRSMVAHLHFLGSSAQRRFDLLQISYNAFIVGLVLSFTILAVVAVRFYL